MMTIFLIHHRLSLVILPPNHEKPLTKRPRNTSTPPISRYPRDFRLQHATSHTSHRRLCLGTLTQCAPGSHHSDLLDTKGFVTSTTLVQVPVYQEGAREIRGLDAHHRDVCHRRASAVMVQPHTAANTPTYSGQCLVIVDDGSSGARCQEALREAGVEDECTGKEWTTAHYESAGSSDIEPETRQHLAD